VREVEAWLMADREGFSQYFSVNIDKIQPNTESIVNPKEYLLELIKISRKKDIRTDILPRYPSDKRGPAYNSRLCEFVQSMWGVERAQSHSRSLDRAFSAIMKISE